MLLRECDRCGKVDRNPYDIEEGLCVSCREVDSIAREKAFAAMRTEFGKHVAASVTIVNLCKSLRDSNPVEWHKLSGSQGDKLLDEVLNQVGGE